MRTLRVAALLALSGLAVAANDTPDAAATQNKAIATALASRSRQVNTANERYKSTVESAEKLRDQAVSTANRSAVKTLTNLAQTFTRTGKLADAIETYKVICSFDPTNKEAIKALKAVGISPTDASVAGAGDKFAGNKTQGAAKVEYEWQKTTPVSPDQDWRAMALFKVDDVVDIKAAGTWGLGGQKKIEPSGRVIDGVSVYFLQGRMSSTPANWFIVGGRRTLIVPRAGQLEMRISLPTSQRKNANGKLNVTIKLRKKAKAEDDKK